MIRYFLLLICISTIVSCQKNKRDQIFNIVYAVDVFACDSIAISYHSDYYVASGNLNFINPLDTLDHNLYLNNTLWLGTRNTTNEEEGYYINVNFEDFNISSGASYGVRVYVNDTFLIDQHIGNYSNENITLSGNIPEDFK